MPPSEADIFVDSTKEYKRIEVTIFLTPNTWWEALKFTAKSMWLGLTNIRIFFYIGLIRHFAIFYDYIRTGKLVIDLGEWIDWGHGIKTIALILKDIGMTDEQIVCPNRQSFLRFIQEHYLQDYHPVIHTTCGKIAQYVSQAEMNSYGRLVPTLTAHRMMPDGTEPTYKSNPCYSCGRMIDFISNRNELEVLEKETIHV
jgi:hypothetical protein